MKQNEATYYAWIGASCDYGHDERAGGAATIVEHQQQVVRRDVIADLHTTEFRMLLTLMAKTMHDLPEAADILFLSNAAYIQNFDKTPAEKTANADLIERCIAEKARHTNVAVKVVPYHKNPLLKETHDAATTAMKEIRGKEGK